MTPVDLLLLGLCLFDLFLIALCLLVTSLASSPVVESANKAHYLEPVTLVSELSALAPVFTSTKSYKSVLIGDDVMPPRPRQRQPAPNPPIPVLLGPHRRPEFAPPEKFSASVADAMSKGTSVEALCRDFKAKASMLVEVLPTELEKVKLAVSYLSDRASREYNKAKATNNDTHLSWAAFIQFLDDLFVGTSPTLHDKQKALSEFDFLEVGKKTNKNLVQTIEKFLTIYHDISGDLTPVSRVYAIMHALRNIPSLVADLSTDPMTNEPYSDPDRMLARLRTRNMEWQQAMDAPTWGVGVVSPTVAGANTFTPARNNKRPASPDFTPAAGRSRLPRPAFKPENEVPLGMRKALGGPEDSYYIKGLTNPMRATLRAEGKCFLCKLL